MLSEKQKLKHSLLFPVFFTALLWIVKLFEISFNLDFVRFGIYPLTLKGLPGIITAPFVHGNMDHLYSNTIPLLILSIAVFYFYRPIYYKIFFYSWIITGIWIWVVGRESYHIGASGLIYALASFLFFSGIIRNDIRLMALSLLVVFLYGSMIWGIFPIQPEISWESHLMGGIAGFMLAVHYRKYGPRKIIHEWEDENEDDHSGTETNTDSKLTSLN